MEGNWQPLRDDTHRFRINEFLEVHVFLFGKFVNLYDEEKRNYRFKINDFVFPMNYGSLEEAKTEALQYLKFSLKTTLELL